MGLKDDRPQNNVLFHAVNILQPSYCYQYLNKNTKGAKKCKANQKQQLLTKTFDITLRPRNLEYNDYNADNGYS